MSEDKKSKKNGDFLAGKGFYFVLFACIAVIGVSAWILLFTGGSELEVDEAGEEVGSYSLDLTNRDERQEVSAPDYSGFEDAFSKQETQPSVSPPAANQQKKPEENNSSNKPETMTPPASSEAKPQAPSPAPNESSEKPVEKQKTIAEMTFVWPVAGKIDTEFSVEMPVYNRTLAVWRVHTGVDISAALGTKVLAVTDGQVTDVFEDDMMGTTVVVDHGDNLKSMYSNLAVTPVVKVGDKIAMGAVIGAVGNTALGEIGQVSHVHLEMSLDGDAVNPEDYLPDR